jgi:hypothetical protein
MLTSGSHQPTTTLFKLMETRTVENPNFQPGIPSPVFNEPSISKVKPLVKSNTLLSKNEQAATTKHALCSSKVFSITFRYSQMLCYTKVLKVIYRPGECIYKVVLHSQVSSSARMCWLQLRTQGWNILLGQDLNEELISAITSAIASQE